MTINDFFKAIQENNLEGVIAGVRAGFNDLSKNEEGECALDVALELEHTAIAAFLAVPSQLPEQQHSAALANELEPIAIVGMSCRFAGEADNLDNFWANLMSQRSTKSTVPSNRYVTRQDYLAAKSFPASFLKQDIGLFDAEFFRISHAEAALMDPQQRMLLEETYHAFEQGGFDVDALRDQQIGVYVGQMTHDYADMMRADSDEGDPRFATGNIDSVLSGRIAYFFNFLGEALTLNTACSSSLAGLHIASNSLRQGQVNMAVVAGVNAIIDPRLMQTAASARMTSPDGVCKAFNINANGYGRGEGVGVVLLKRLSDAVRDGDNVMALVRGSALNQDGQSSKLTAPMKDQQVAVIKQALQASHLSPDDIDVIEAHGTGTVLGDRIESEALSHVFGHRPPHNRIKVRSVKSNIGHCEAAAGIASVIKTVLSLKYAEVPGQAQLTQLNPKLDLAALSIESDKREWNRKSEKSRLAGISSFGFSGTNAHVIIEEAPKLSTNNHETFNKKQLLVLSAQNENALNSLVEAYKVHLGKGSWSQENLANLAYTAAIGRKHFKCRRAIIFSSYEDLLKQLDQKIFHYSRSVADELKEIQLEEYDYASSHDAYLHHLATCYEFGNLINWAKVWKGNAFKKIDLPLYPFQRERYWYNSVLSIRPRNAIQQDHNLRPVHLAGGAMIYEYRLNLNDEALSFLGGHRVGERVVFPGSAYIDLIIRALKPLQEPSSVNIENIQFKQALFLNEDVSTICQIRLTPSKKETIGYDVDIFAWSEQETVEKAVCYAQASIGYTIAPFDMIENIDTFKSSAKHELNSEHIYQRLKALGLSYGLDWQLVSHAYIKDNQALVELTASDEGREGVVCLDTALHATIALIDLNDIPFGTSLVPKRIENLIMAGNLSQTKYLMLNTSHKGKGFDFQIKCYDEQGSLLAALERYSAASIKADNLHANSRFNVEWQPHELSDSLDEQLHFNPNLNLQQLQVSLPSLSELPLKDDVWLQNYGLIVFSMILVKRWPSLQKEGEVLNIKQIETGKKPEDHFFSLFEKGFRHLAALNFVYQEGNRVTVIKALESYENLAKKLEAIKVNEQDIQQVFLKSVTQKIDEIIDGKINALDVLFPKDVEPQSFRHAATVYQLAKDARLANLICKNVVKALQGFASDKQIRILEIGAGTGGTTKELLPELSGFQNISYVYTDRSASFANKCDEIFAQTGINHHFAVLDISKNPAEQGFANAQFDIVIATNVLHATPNIVETMKHVERLLVKNGVAVISETVEDAVWLDLTFGLTRDWWAFKDDIRNQSPLLKEVEWERLLKNTDMSFSCSYGGSQMVFLASANKKKRLSSAPTTESRHFFIIDSRWVRAHLRQALLEHGMNEMNMHWSHAEQIDKTIPLIQDCEKPYIYFIAPNALEEGVDMLTYQRDYGVTLLKLLQALNNKPASINLLISDNQVAPEHATLTGFLTSAANENNQWQVKVISCPDGFDRQLDLAKRVIKLSISSSLEREFIVEEGQILVPRMMEASTHVATSTPFSSDGVVLITGGDGQIGQALVAHLAKQGHRQFALLTRKEKERTKAHEPHLELKYYLDDLSDERKLAATWAEVESTQGPVKKVFHLAGTLADKNLKDMRWEDIATVFKAKVIGSYHLHLVSRQYDISHFVLFSSIASLLSTPGQMNHVAANRYIDALAKMRRNIGLPAVSINWGFWSEIGSAARIGADIKGQQRGYLALKPAECFQAMDDIISANPITAVMAKFDWQVFFKQFGSQTVPPLFLKIANQYASSLDVKGELSEARFDWKGYFAQYPEPKDQVKALANQLIVLIRSKLRIPDKTDIRRSWTEVKASMDSLFQKEIVDMINAHFGLQDQHELTTNVFYSDKTIDDMADDIRQKFTSPLPVKAKVKTLPLKPSMASMVAEDESKYADDAVAIVGMSLRFPGANNAQEFWRVLSEGLDPIEAENPGRQGENCYFGHHQASSAKKAKVGFLSSDISQFDAEFFGIKDEEATVMDPQQRLLLQLVWEALENAGIAPSTLKETNTGVVMGIAANEFGELLLHHSALEDLSKFHASGNNTSATAGRISHYLGLQGPNTTVNTACSSSLVSLDAACHQIIKGGVEMAIIGAINLILSPKQMQLYQINGMSSPTDHCHTFSDQADGMVRSEGCAVYILKSLQKARLDGDNILAVIEGSAVNQNGASLNFMAPVLNAQQALIEKSLAAAKIESNQLDWVETHGTGTKLGDPVEVEALVSKLGSSDKKLALGAVKSNIGHLEAAAGAAGLSKIVMALQQQIIPANRFDGSLNPQLNKFASRLMLLSKSMPWPKEKGRVRRALLSSFGFSGTNSQAVIAEPPTKDILLTQRLKKQWDALSVQNPIWAQLDAPQVESTAEHLFVISSKTKLGLQAQILQLKQWLEAQADSDNDTFLERVALTLSKGRDHFEYRFAIVAKSRKELIQGLDEALEKGNYKKVTSQANNLAFLFTGQGSQYANMGKDLYQYNPLYRAIFDHCARLLQAELDDSLYDIVFGVNAPNLIEKTSHTQPVLFVLEYALAQVLMAYGLQPDYVLGHSVGEYVAATLSGCMHLEDSLKLVCARGRIMEKAQNGKMIAVPCSADEAMRILTDNRIILDIAAQNTATQTVLSGDAVEVTKAIEIFKLCGKNPFSLTVNKAFHSRCMQSILAEFQQFAEGISYHQPNEIIFISSLTGQRVTTALNATHWVKHLRFSVNFMNAINTLDKMGVAQLYEVGSATVLLKFAKKILHTKESQLQWYDGLSSSSTAKKLPGHSDVKQIHSMLAKYYQFGGKLNFQAMWVCSTAKPIELPTYAFQTKSYWPHALGGPKLESVQHESLVSEENRQESLSPAQQTVVNCLKKALSNIQKVVLDASFNEHGGSSLELPNFQEALYQATGLTWSIKELQEINLCDLASQFSDDFEALETHSAMANEAAWYQEFPLNPIQFAYWIGRQGIIPLGHVSAHGYLEVKMRTINIWRLQSALNQLIQQHHMLRVIVNKKGQQQVLPKVPEYIIPVSNVTSDKKLEEIRGELSHQVKDASIWPLFDIRISKIAADHYRLHLSFDSLIIDMYSMRLLFDEWYQLYSDESYRLTPLSFTFKDYNEAIERLKTEAQYKKAESYWLEKVKTMPLGPDLPLLMEPAKLKDQKFARCSGVVSEVQWAIIKSKAKQLGVSPTTVLLVIFSVVLGHYSRRKEFLVNLTLFRRKGLHPEVKKLLGDFTNVEVFQADVRTAYNLRFDALVSAAHERLLDDLEHADYNGVDVQRALAKEHRLDHNETVAPIVFTSLLNLKLERESGQQRGDSVWQQFGEVEYSTTQTPQIWLDHKTFESSEGLVVEWDYVQALFGQEMMMKMHQYYIDYIRYVSVSDWKHPLPDVISDDVRQQMCQYNATANPAYIEKETLCSLIGKAYTQYSTHRAVFSESSASLTFAEFEAKTKRIATTLQKMGIQKGDYVGVNIDRSVNMLLAIVGVLQAGGVYLPIEPSLPTERQYYLVQDSNAKVVLTDVNKHCIWEKETTKAILIDDALSMQPDFTPVDIRPDDCAYLLYTSGSSGRPKGVLIDHRGVVNRLLWMKNDYRINERDVFIQKTPISFDVSIWELFLPLISGASVFMPKPDGHKDITYLKGVMKQHQITQVHFVPSMLEIFLQAQQVTHLPSLKTVFCSGEALLPAQVNRFNQCYQEAKIVNFYGPTEASVDVTYWNAPKTPVTEVPIGQPAANVEVMIVDSMGLPCPQGVSGELWLAGVQVGKGYLNLPIKTDEAFFENPYSFSPEAKRAYRTGDLAYLNNEKQIIYQGRMDRQVKIRGQRIELGEVRHGVSSLATVKQAEVLAINNASGKPALVSFIWQDKMPSQKEINAKLATVEITDEGARKAFAIENSSRLKQQTTGLNIPLFDDVMPPSFFSRKSYRSYTDTKLSHEELVALLHAKPEVLTPQKFNLANCLKSLAAYQVSQQAIAKYPYPSAGSLYPVKCYLAIGENDQKIEPGYYCFDQIKHQLVQLKQDRTSIAPGIQISLVAHEKLIAPLYGEFWRDFAAVEAGTMLALLSQQCQSMNMGMTKTEVTTFASSLACVSDRDEVCGSWTIEPRRPTVKQTLTSHLWFAISDENDGLIKHLYSWDGKAFHRQADGQYPLHLLDEGINQQMIAQSSAIVFFTQVEDRMNVGQELMNWMTAGLKQQIGICPMGTCPVPVQWADIMGKNVLLAVSIGGITRQQIQAQENSSATGSAIDISTFLQEQLKKTALTEAMYPERFVLVPEIPTTTNGKLDDKALMEMMEKSTASNTLSLIKPKTLLEQQIFEIWQEKGILNGKTFGIDDTYITAGGNSMTQNVLSLRLQEVFKVEITSADVYGHSSIAKQAQLIDSKQDEDLKTIGEFPLAQLVIKGNLKRIEDLLKKNVDINQQDSKGRTALYIAAYHGYQDIVALLLRHHAQVDLAKHIGTTPKDCAKRMGHTQLELLFTPARLTGTRVQTLFTGSDSLGGASLTTTNSPRM